MVKVIWQNDRVAVAHGWFSGIHQVAPVYTIWIGSAIFAQLMAECHCTLQWAAPFPR